MKRLLALTLALLLVLGMFTACTAKQEQADQPAAEAQSPANNQTTESETPAEGGERTIRMWTFLDLTSENGRAKVLAKLIDNFQTANPGVTVKVETQEWSTLASKIFAAAESGEAPDVFMVNTANLGEAINRGICEPLENLFYSDWTDAQKDDIDSAIFQQGFDGTYHYEIPFFYGAFGVMYRKDLFEAKGINADDIHTWAQLAEAAQQLTGEENGQKIWGYGIGYSLDVTDPHGALPATLFGQAGGMFTDDGQPNNWTGESAQKALQYELDQINVYGCTPASAASITSEDVYTDFAAGNYAMIAAGSIRMPTVQGTCAFDPEDIGFMALPGIDENTPGLSYAAGWNTAVWSGSKNKDVAGKFLEYLCSAEADELWVTEAQQIPLLKSTLENCSDFLSQPTNEWVIQAKNILLDRAYVQSIKYSVSGFNEDLQNAFQLAFVDGMSVEDALAEVEANFIDRNTAR